MTAESPHITCFACARCEYPVCDSEQLLLRKVRQGPSEYAFHYNLDGLLDLDDAQVPCYSAAEVVHTSAVVSETLMKSALPPAAQVVALESIVQSRKHWMQQRRSMNAHLHEHGVSQGAPAPNADAVSTPATDALPAAGVSTPTPAPRAPTDGYSGSGAERAESDFATGAPVIRRYGDTAESRIDLVCVKAEVLDGGVQECTRDRSAVATQVGTPLSRSREAARGVGGVGAVSAEESPTPTVVRDASFSNIPQDVMKAATAPAADTRWTSPGNFCLREAFIEVNRSTLSSRAPWFQDFECVSRVQCPDCHQPLGFVFSGRGAGAAGEATQPPHAKKSRNEGDASVVAAETQGSPQGRDGGGQDTAATTAVEGGGPELAPDRFVGLELKRVVQRSWTLRAFQERYSKAHQLQSFRELFPEAEELQSLYSRLLGLRTQAELYSSLLRRHKEQNDVQMALLSSNRDRMHTFDEKIKTMQQIIEAQRAQIEMQSRQIRNQEELVQSHRRQFMTQQRQMDVEQLLLEQQSKTIASQKEQLQLLKTHFQATRPDVLLDPRLCRGPGEVAAMASAASAARARAGGATTATVAGAASAARPPTQSSTASEHDWDDVEEEAVDGADSGDEEKVVGSRVRRAVAVRGMPPAHLCGVRSTLSSPISDSHPAPPAARQGDVEGSTSASPTLPPIV